MKNKQLNRKIAKMFVVSSCMLSMMPTTVLANETTQENSTNTKNLSSYTVAYEDVDSVKQIISGEFGYDSSNLVYKETTETNNTPVIKFSSDDYQVAISNLHLDSAGSQKVTIQMYKADSANEDNLSLVQSPIEIDADEAAMDSKTNNSSLESGVITTKQAYVTVTDSKGPTIDGPDTLETDQGTAIDIKSNYKASDDKDGNIEVGLEGSVDFGKAGTYGMTVTAKDLSGNLSTKNIIINVKENSDASSSDEGTTNSSKNTISGQATSFSQKIADAALSQVGVNQDCTMLVTNSLKAVGISFHGWPIQYAALGEWTDTPVPGDIIIYQGHVAIYIGNGQAVHGGWLGVTTVVSSVQCTNQLIGYIHVSQ